MPDKKEKAMNILEQLKEIKLLPVISLDKEEDALPLAKALMDGGLPCAEVTFRKPRAEKCISAMKKAFPDMLVGAGTVLTKKQVDLAIEAGASFIVSPGFNRNVVKYCIERKIPIFPGCSSPSDIESALELGLNVVKFFPAEQLGGINMLKALAAPYAMMQFIPTGGINEKNISSYLSQKNVLACGGSFMIDKQLLLNKDFNGIEKLVKEVMNAINGKEASPIESRKEEAIKDKVYHLGGRVVCFGEIMLRLAPEGYMRFLQAKSYGATYGGGEANVSVSLANFGMNSSYVTKLPDNEIGQAGINELRKFGVDTKDIVRGGNRVGIYYLEKGASQRPSKVIYDRAYSSIAMAKQEDFDWDKIFEGVEWFHFTGITPALSDDVAKICEDACIAAKKRNVTISCDLNYRKKLWSKEKARNVMGKLCKYVDVCIANEEDASDVFQIKASNTDIVSGKVNYEGYKEVARKLVEQFAFEKVAITLRTSISANDNNWSAMLYDGEQYYFSKQYKMHIVDRVGGGDSFGAGLIYSIMHNMEPQDIIEFATAASCLKHSIEGDFNMITVEEVNKLANGDGSGRVQR